MNYFEIVIRPPSLGSLASRWRLSRNLGHPFECENVEKLSFCLGKKREEKSIKICGAVKATGKPERSTLGWRLKEIFLEIGENHNKAIYSSAGGVRWEEINFNQSRAARGEAPEEFQELKLNYLGNGKRGIRIQRAGISGTEIR
jgi:hypothetical protein